MKKTPLLRITSDPLNLEEANDYVINECSGAISIFVGTTRNNFQGKKVIELEYEGYEPMAIKEMEKICAQIYEKWPEVENIAILHRLGIVKVKESSVIIAISSPHRQQAMQAVQYAIDTLKATVPIWKLEKYENDQRRWKENVEWDGKRVMIPESM